MVIINTKRDSFFDSFFFFINRKSLAKEIVIVRRTFVVFTSETVLRSNGFGAPPIVSQTWYKRMYDKRGTMTMTTNLTELHF